MYSPGFSEKTALPSLLITPVLLRFSINIEAPSTGDWFKASTTFTVS